MNYSHFRCVAGIKSKKMQERHDDRKSYFDEQGITTKKYVIPYIEHVRKIEKGTRVLEIGCGEGGNLSPFIDLECEVVGIDLSGKQIENAKRFIAEAYGNPNVQLLNRDIYDVSQEEVGQFDVIFLRDVIEHIPDQNTFMNHMKSFIKPDGVIFFGFPPWTMPFGGHQQICHSRFLSKLPYFHLFPNIMYRSFLKMFGEKQSTIDSLMEIKDTGIGINKFQKIVRSNNYRFVKKDLYFINPNYETKFGLKPRLQSKIIGSIPYFRDFFTTCMYCVVENEKTTTESV